MRSRRKFVAGDEVLVASHNDGKIREIADLLAPYSVKPVSFSEHPFPEPEETGLTFRENSEIKAVSAAKATGIVALADDSGLEVDALAGEPGVYSARWAGRDKDFRTAMHRVEQSLSERGAVRAKQRQANFVCDLCVAWPDGGIDHFEGRVYGTLIWPPRGDKGFGYDPMFLPRGHSLTFGEMEDTAKHRISHRAQAFRLFLKAYEPCG